MPARAGVAGRAHTAKPHCCSWVGRVQNQAALLSGASWAVDGERDAGRDAGRRQTPSLQPSAAGGSSAPGPPGPASSLRQAIREALSTDASCWKVGRLAESGLMHACGVTAGTRWRVYRVHGTMLIVTSRT